MSEASEIGIWKDEFDSIEIPEVEGREYWFWSIPKEESHEARTKD